jgi:hypothetical protein
MKSFLLLAAIICTALFSVHSQTVFNEIFNEGNGAADGSGTTVGADALGTTWTATCPYCGPSGDWLEIDQAGNSELEAADTNGPAFWETADFDISACTDGITISVDMRETGTAEALSCGGACNLADGIKFEVSYDSGTSWIPYSDAINGFVSTCVVMSECGTSDCQGCGACGANPACELTNYPVPWGVGTDVTGPFIGTGEIGSTNINFADCASVGISNTMRFRLTFMCWSSAEKWFADNVLAVCSNCALPVEMGLFTAERTTDAVKLNWRTLSESNNKKFRIERSEDGMVFIEIGDTRGQINSTQTMDYEFIDEKPLNTTEAYYRLVQVDLNGKSKYSDIKTVYYNPTNIYFNGTDISINFTASPNKLYTLNIYNLSGQLLHSEKLSTSKDISWNNAGFYIIEIPELNLREKLVIH